MDQCDVLIVGGGGAALRAALAAIELGPELRVVLVTKGALGHSGVTATACSDRMAFHAALPTTEPGGEALWRYHADDIYRIGGCVSDADLAQVLAEGGAAAFDYLDKLGVPWARRPDGVVDQFFTDGSEYPRACYTGPYTANHIEQALLRRLALAPVHVIKHTMVGELLLDKARKRVRGAILVSQVGGTTQAIAAKAVVLATGGAGQAFEVNVYPDDCTGDGYALAYRAGAELVNLEFIQIGLCSLKTKLACSGSMMRALPRLVNDREQEFLMSYMPPGTDYTRMYEILFAKGASWPVSQRDASHILDIAVAAELAAGRRVFLDYARDPEGLDLASFGQNIARWYNEGKGVDGVDLADKARVGTPLARLRAINQPSVDWLAERGVDLAAGDKVEIAPAVQHFQGGVKIRTQGDTTLAGLYAAGEVAGGQHGANRPGGNALLDTQVFGRVAGEGAARYVRSHPCEIDETDAIKPGLAALFARSGVAAGKVRTQVRQAMALYCGVYRTQAGLSTLNALLDALARRGIRRGDSLTSDLEALNILQTARLVARAALERDESRGPHLRFAEDGSLTPLPLDEGWQRYGVLWRGEQGPEWEAREPVRPASAP